MASYGAPPSRALLQSSSKSMMGGGNNSNATSSAGTSSTHAQTPAVPQTFIGEPAAEEPSWSTSSTCVEPDHRELIRSVGTILHRRVRDNESVEPKITLPLFMEDTHTEPEPPEVFDVAMPMLHLQTLSFPTLFTVTKLPPPPPPPRVYPVPSAHEIATFLENIRQKAHLTPQALVITLIYVDRLEARSEGVLLHARSWRPIVFASILLASKVWHDISYWNSDFCSICPMFHTRNINQMEVTYLQLLKYNVLVSASQYASYYFSLRHAVRAPAVGAPSASTAGDAGGAEPKATAVEGAVCAGPAATYSSTSQSLHAGAAYTGSSTHAPSAGTASPIAAPAPTETAAIPAPSAAASFGDSPGAAQAATSADNFRSKYLMALQLPAPHWQVGDEGGADAPARSRHNSFSRLRSTSDDSPSCAGGRRAHSGADSVFANMFEGVSSPNSFGRASRGSRGSRGSCGDTSAPSASILALAHLTEEPEVYRLTEEEETDASENSSLVAPPSDAQGGEGATTRSSRPARDRAERMDLRARKELATQAAWELSRSL